MKKLRPYQREAFSNILKCIDEDSTPILLDASVGAGKSLICAEVLKKYKRERWECLCLTMNSILIEQNAITYNDQGGDAGIFCSGLKRKDTDNRVIFASPHSLISAIKKGFRISKKPFNLILIDECFIGETLIDGVRIDSLRIGDHVNSYNHQTNKIEQKKITHIFKNKCPEYLSCISTHCGVTICTLDHPYYVIGKGYIQAKDLKQGDKIYVNRSNMRHMRRKNNKYNLLSKEKIKTHRTYLSYRRLRLEFSNQKEKFKRKNENKQPHGKSCYPTKNERYIKKDRTQTACTRWKWQRINYSPKNSVKSSRQSLETRIYNQNQQKERQRISVSLQNRYSTPNKINSNRNRWTLSLHVKKTSARQEKREFVNIERVESVKIFQREYLKRLHPNKKFDFVYNIEVEDNNNYFANNVLVHNCHNIQYGNNSSMYMRILNHYGHMAQLDNYPYRILGLTGTPYRDNNVSIVGDHQLFKRVAAEIKMPWLIEQGYLTKPVFNELPDGFDFSSCEVNNFGKFKQSELDNVVEKQRLTAKIMTQVTALIENGERKGAFIFCVSKKHCHEAYEALPKGQAEIITAETKASERKRILDLARVGKVKYLLNVATLLTGVDVPLFDVACFIRPTESLVLFMQAVGRVLRLHPDKETALVLDYAGNLDRFQDWDDPLLNEAQQPTEETEKEYIIPCPECGTMNTEHARRCIKIDDEGKRCQKYFEWKDCPNCETPNDIVSRYCRHCEFELIDPNSRLSPRLLKFDDIEFHVDSMTPRLQGTPDKFSIHLFYKGHYVGGQSDTIHEAYYPYSYKAINLFYAKFVKEHCENSSQWYKKLDDINSVHQLLSQALCPHTLVMNQEKNIRKRYF